MGRVDGGVRVQASIRVVYTAGLHPNHGHDCHFVDIILFGTEVRALLLIMFTAFLLRRLFFAARLLLSTYLSSIRLGESFPPPMIRSACTLPNIFRLKYIWGWTVAYPIFSQYFTTNVTEKIVFDSLQVQMKCTWRDGSFSCLLRHGT